uniref:Protein SDA1 n=1 Tax=Acrobeloides nanus TaxID=290746 RepID=A0A914BXX8_9BILA
MKLIELQPVIHRMDVPPLLESVNFLSSVSSYYPNEAKQFSQCLITALTDRGYSLEPTIRLSFCKALIALRARQVITTFDIIQLFFELAKCEDKSLRKFLLGAIVSFIKVLHRKERKNEGKVQCLIFAKLKDSRPVVARMANLVLIEAFRKGFWKEAKTANSIAECVFHDVLRIQLTSIRFFLGSLKQEEGFDGSDSEDEEANKEENSKTVREVMHAFKHAKKTRKKAKTLEKTKRAISKESKSKKESQSKFCNLEAMQMLYDPQTFADRLFGCLQSKKNEKFIVRLLRMALCARIIGIHKLQTLGFYSYLHRYLQPKQQEVTRILLYAAHACHDLVPPDLVQDVVRVIAQNFVTDRNTNEGITVGLNAIREIFVNCPSAATEDLLQDLAEYKVYKNKNVSMAARGLITLFRTVNPKLLHRKDRGRPIEGTNEVATRGKDYGSLSAVDFVPGAEILQEEEDFTNDRSIEDNSDEEWSDVSDLEDEIEQSDEDTTNEDEFETDIDENDSDEEEVNDEESEHSDEEIDEEIRPDDNGKLAKDSKQITKSAKKKLRSEEKKLELETKLQKAKMISESRILTDTDFRKIRSYQIKKQLGMEKSSRKRPNDEVRLEEELEEKIARREEGDGLAKLNDIMHFHKKIRRQTKEERMAEVQKGREDREEYGKPKKKGPHVGRTNRELAKRKDFRMVRQKVRGKNRQRSFRDQQMSLRKYLLRQAGKKV